MRKLKNEGPFWIDTLGNDQSDPKEKEKQLQLMPKIYKHAAVVLVWLGKGVKKEEPALELLHESYARGMDGFRTAISSSVTWRTPKLCLRFIIENEYWTRPWTVQQINMAKKIDVYTGT